MPRPRDSEAEDFGDDEDALADPEGPQSCDLDADDAETPTIPCPNCGAEVPDMADRCPYCGDWIVQGGQTGVSARSVVFAAVVLLTIVALLYWLL